EFLKAHHQHSIFISAESKIGLEPLKQRIGEFYDQGRFANASEDGAPIQNIGWEEERPG
ncbi:MAG: hypothetical protein JWP91_1779, partial [Fibrobacteres bacterium]|nr:hypothetical protein [Fibrobacterota bacterium]